MKPSSISPMQVKKGAKKDRVRPTGEGNGIVRPIVVEGVGSESRELEFTVPE